MRTQSAVSLALVSALALAWGGVAQADGRRLSDEQFLQAAQCVGMTYDAQKIEAMESLVRSEKKGREGALRWEANNRQQKAKSALLHASGPKRVAMEDAFAAQCDPLLAQPQWHADAAPKATETAAATPAVADGATMAARKESNRVKDLLARVFGRNH